MQASPRVLPASALMLQASAHRHIAGASPPCAACLTDAGECPPAPEGFVLEAGRDAPGYNLGENRAEERHPGNVPAIARRCAARWNCRSFNLEGWVKSVLSTVYRPGACFYIKQGA